MAVRSIVWLRRDLRLDDNHAVFAAARAGGDVVLAFVLDPPLLRGPRMGAPLVQTFFSALGALRDDLRKRGSDLALLEGDFAGELIALARRTGARTLFYNVDYEPDAIARDRAVEGALRHAGIEARALLDHVYFGANEVLQPGGGPYRVFTPYKKRWLDQRALAPRAPFRSAAAIASHLAAAEAIGATSDIPAPEAWGFASSAAYPRAGEQVAQALLTAFLRNGIARYGKQRDLPSLDGTSHLSPQLRAGTIGIRTCVESAFALLADRDRENAANISAWIGELIWRDFYQMVLATWPRVATGPFIESTSAIPWRESPSDFAAWCEGRTGFPIVDAGMRQLNETGWMHNRLRMITASFLTKDLLVDWRLGERYFERRLADADLAQNNGGWQWSSSTGTDAVPYFRIFNPVVQSRRFDPDGTFIRSMVPQLRRVPARYVHAPWEMPPLIAAEAGCTIGHDYPAPIVDHAFARDRALQAFRSKP